MQCPNCSSEMWDNRETKRNPKQPDYKCKDKSCGHAIWLDSKKKSNGASTPVKAAGPKWTWPQLGTLYQRSLLIAAQKLKSVGITTPDAIVAATATVFIAASRDGVAEPKKEQPATTQPEPDEDGDSDVPF